MDQKMLEDIYKKKISAEFELFRKKKYNIESGKRNSDVYTDNITDLDEILKNNQIENTRLAEMYKEHANALRKEVEDGIFSEGKKCNNCERFYQDYENSKEMLPCPKMTAYAKMLKENERLTKDDYDLVRSGQFHCGDLYIPCMDQADIAEEVKELEEEQVQTINEWEAIALLGLDNL